MVLSDLIVPDAALGVLKSQSKKRLLQDLATVAAERYELPEDDLFRALQSREQLGPTGVGRGVAIPHARIPELGVVRGLFARLSKPVDYDAVDNQPVDLIFLLVAPSESGAEHLKALARVSRVLRDEDVCKKLRSTDEAAAQFAILTEHGAVQAA